MIPLGNSKDRIDIARLFVPLVFWKVRVYLKRLKNNPGLINLSNLEYINDQIGEMRAYLGKKYSVLKGISR